MLGCSSEAVLEQADCTEPCCVIKNKNSLQKRRKRRRLPGTPRADVECNFGLWLRLIGAAPLAELAAGWSQARHALHAQVIQVLWQWRARRRGKRRKGRKKESTEGTSHHISLCSLSVRWR